MEQAEIDRLRRVLRSHRPPLRWVVMRAGRSPVMQQRWREERRRVGWRWTLARRLRYHWRWLWTYGLERRLADPLQRKLSCPRGRHRYAHLLADELVGSQLGDDYPELAICERCGHAVPWPNGMPDLRAGPPTRPRS
jgi:hypothetical protein